MMLIGHQLQTSYQYFLIYQQSDQCLQFGSENGMYIECMKCEQISSKFVTGLQNPINTSVVRKPGRVTTMTCKLNKKSLKKITALGSMTYLNKKTTGCHLKNSHMALLRVLNTNQNQLLQIWIGSRFIIQAQNLVSVHICSSTKFHKAKQKLERKPECQMHAAKKVLLFRNKIQSLYTHVHRLNSIKQEHKGIKR